MLPTITKSMIVTSALTVLILAGLNRIKPAREFISGDSGGWFS